MQLTICTLTALLAATAFAPAQEPAHDPKTIGRILHALVWTGQEALVWGGGSEGHFFGHGLRIDPTATTRTVLAERGAPSGRWGHAAAWTGRELIVWGGRSQFESDSHHADGARYDPRTDCWKPMTNTNAPTARSQLATVWTGDELLVWGGYGNGATAHRTGGRYDPKTDRWRSLAVAGSPEARVEPLAVWTGTELLVWGGITPDLKRTFRSGARYHPATDTWTPMATEAIAPSVWGAPAVWTGREMLVWGGSYINGDENINAVQRTGAAYDPVRNRWRALSVDGAPAARFFHSSVWTGTHLIVWGGGDQEQLRSYDDGGVYDPARDRWTPLVWDKRPPARGMHAAVWTGRGMMVFGGSTGGSSAFADAALWVQP